MKNSKWLAKLLGWLMVLLLAAPVAVFAKDGGSDFSQEELAQMLAPVALYPDALLSQVLMAATYPLEVVAADRWLRKNSLLTGDNLDEALRDQDWDASVKALCSVPAVLGLMSERLEETTRLGDAFLAQEKEVMDTIQDLRARAMREGNLKSDDKQKVTVQEDGTIVIESADPQTVYVPYYNTSYVYGPWWYPAWPPWYWGPGEVVIGSGIYFWPDFYFGFGFGFGYWSHFDWSRRTIFIDVQRRPHFYRPDYDWGARDGRWRHEPSHRQGVVYRDRPTAERFGQPPTRVKQAERQSARAKVVRGPVTAGGVSAVGASVQKKPVTTGKSAERKKGEPARATTGVDNVGGQEAARGGAGGGVERRTRESNARRSTETVKPVVETAPRVEPVRPAPESRRQESEVRRENTRTRELTTDQEVVPGDGRDGSYQRRGGFGREERQLGREERQERERGGRR
jgi:hypothetical protein